MSIKNKLVFFLATCPVTESHDINAVCGSVWFFFPQTISLLVYVSGGLGKKGPFLILSPLSVMENWRKELERYSSPAESITNRLHVSSLQRVLCLVAASPRRWLSCVTKETRRDVRSFRRKQTARRSLSCSPRMRSVCHQVWRTKWPDVSRVSGLTASFYFLTAVSQRRFILEAVSLSPWRVEGNDVLKIKYNVPCKPYVSALLLRWNWKVLVVDEAHRLKDQNSLLHKTLTRVLSFVPALKHFCSSVLWSVI